MRLSQKSIKRLAVAVVLSIGAAAPALAGSVTQPGDTMGSPSGAPAPQGIYLVDQINWGCNKATPRVCVQTDIPIAAWSTPWTILGGSLLFATAPTTEVDVSIHNTHHATGLFNPFVAGELAWDLGHGFGFSYLLGTYVDIDSPVAYSSTSLNQRFGLSYLDNGWNLTENTIWGINFDHATSKPQGFPCPGSFAVGCNPNFVNVDLTATKRFGNWEFGPIGFYSTDLSTPIPGYPKQSKSAIGGLVGYWFGPVILQIYATSEVYEKNYGGKDSRVWSRLIIPILDSPAP